MNSAEDFWARVDRSGGPEACWCWIGARDSKGRVWCRYQGKVHYAHHISEFLTSGSWPRRGELRPCPRDAACCNPKHFVRCQPKRRRSFSRAVKRTATDITRMRAFSMMLDRLHPDLRWLAALMGDRAARFISVHEGQELTLTMKIPRREELIEAARSVDSYIQLREAKPENRAEVLSQLAHQYECSRDEVLRFAMLGQTLLNAANEEVCDGQN